MTDAASSDRQYLQQLDWSRSHGNVLVVPSTDVLIMKEKTVVNSRLAIEGGHPVRTEMLPYGRHWLDSDDVAAMVETLQSAWLTTGPKVGEFERAFAETVDARCAVAVCNGTAALHTAMHALGIGPGDEVIVPAITFAATANCVVYRGGRPVFADVLPDTLLIDPKQVENLITPRTKAVIAVDYAGQPCDYETLRSITDEHRLALVADACHALGAEWRGRKVGSIADLSAFSLHPVKHVTAGEGGVVTTEDAGLAARMRTFRNHGISTEHRQREQQGSWFYEMVDLGFNYRLTDFQCALGLSQLRKLPRWLARRREIARRYDEAFADLHAIQPLTNSPEATHAYHLYVVKLDLERLSVTRERVFAALRAEGIGVNVHYIPVHLHPFYRERLGTRLGDCPVAEAAYERLLTLPLYPRMSDNDVTDVTVAVTKVIARFSDY